MLKVYDEPESPQEGACLRCMANLDRQMRGIDEPKSPHGGRGESLKKCDEPESPHEGLV